MSISITFSSANGGSAISEPLDHGDAASGSNTTAQTIYVRHDGNNPITKCKLFLAEKSGAYSGSATAAADKTELIGWGDNLTSGTFGGIQFNFDAAGSFPSSAWGTVTSKSPTNGSTVRTGVGDSQADGVLITSASGASSDGVIDNGSSPNVRFQMRAKVPSSGAGTGIRQFDIGLAFSYTS